MVSIVKTGSPTGEIAKAKLAIDEVNKIFKFCKKFDIVDGDTKPDNPYIFDVRPEAVHILDPNSKEIRSSMYIDRLKGDMTIEAEEGSWTTDLALNKWAEVITNALKG
jgi:hypothetical protein